MEHFCHSQCCSSKKVAEGRMDAAVLSVMLRHMPVAPSLGKWTKLGAAVDFYVFGFVHDILQKLWQTAFVKLVVQRRLSLLMALPRLGC